MAPFWRRFFQVNAIILSLPAYLFLIETILMDSDKSSPDMNNVKLSYLTICIVGYASASFFFISTPQGTQREEDALTLFMSASLGSLALGCQIAYFKLDKFDLVSALEPVPFFLTVLWVVPKMKLGRDYLRLHTTNQIDQHFR
jgi:hypothetical protein